MTEVTTVAEYEHSNFNDLSVMMPTDEDNKNLHPLLIALGEGDVIQKVKILSEFDDDHIECYTLQVITDKRDDYVIGLWWQGAEGFAHWVRAEGNAEKSKELYEEYHALLLTDNA